MWLVCMNLQYPRYHCTNPMFLLVDNKDSPSLVDQSQQGCGSSSYTLLAVVPRSVKCLMTYACQLASCNMGLSCCGSHLLSLCPYIPHVLFHNSLYCCSLCCSLWFSWGSAATFFIQGVFSLKPGIACLCAPWDSLSSFLGLQLGRCILG